MPTPMRKLSSDAIAATWVSGEALESPLDARVSEGSEARHVGIHHHVRKLDRHVSLPQVATPPNIECASPALVPQAPHHHPETKTIFLTVQNVLPMAHTANRHNWRYDLMCGISYCEDVIKASVVNDVRPLLLCDARRSLPRYADRSIVRNWWPSRIHTWRGLHCCNSKSRAWAGTAEAAVAGTRSRLLFEVALDQVGSSHKTL